MSKRNLLRKQASAYSNNPATSSSNVFQRSNKFSFKKVTLFIHNDDFSTNEVLINTQVFPMIQIGDVLEIVVPQPKHVSSSSLSSTSASSLSSQPHSASTPTTTSTPVSLSSDDHLSSDSESTTTTTITSNHSSYAINNSTTTTASHYSSQHHSTAAATQSTINQNTNNTMNTSHQSLNNNTTSQLTISTTNLNHNTNATTHQPQPQQPHHHQQQQQSEQSYVEPLMVRVDSLQQMRGVQYLSVLKSVADLFGLQNRKEVLVRCVKPERAYLDYVEISVRDHFISRSDMWRFSIWLSNKSVFACKSIQWNGFNAQVKELIRKVRMPNGETKNQKVSTGIIVHEHTKITFRSKSAILYWLFQMSKEMWEYTPVHEYDDGNLYFEKAVNGFVKEIFEKWRGLDTNHSLCMIFFSRHFVSSHDNRTTLPTQSTQTEDEKHGNNNEYSSIIQMKDGRKYIDFYKVIDWNDTQHLSPQDMLVRLKREFISYPSSIQRVSASNQLTLANSSAQDGNFLEAINLVLNAYDTYYANRDLTRTGQEIVIISPGVGLFNNLYPALGRITTKRLMDHGLSVDLICLTQPPLHSVPILKYVKKSTTTSGEYYYYRSPDWINISFYLGNLASHNPARFITTCKMPIPSEQLMNMHNMKLPKLPSFQSLNMEMKPSAFEDHDESVFSLSDTPTSPRLSSPRTRNSITSESDSNQSKLLVGGRYPRQDSSAKEQLYMHSLFNPFDIDRSETMQSPASFQQRHQKNTFHRRRWAHLHPSSSGLRPTQKAEYIKHFLTKINWQSLTEPACMPLTTDYWPGSLLKNSEDYELRSKAIVDQSGQYTNSHMLLRELVLQRLHEGFQVYVPDTTPINDQSGVRQLKVTPMNDNTLDEQQKDTHQNASSTSSTNVADDSSTPSTNVYLCSANQLHQIKHEGTGSIIVDRYITKETKKTRSRSTSISSEVKPVEIPDNCISDNKSMYSYKYLLWNSTVGNFENRNIRFYSQVAYNWDKLDDLICGSQLSMGNDLHNRSIQFHLLPITQSNMKYFVSPSIMQTLSTQQSINSQLLSSSPCSPSSENCASPSSFDDAMYPSSLTGSESSSNLTTQHREAMYKNRVKAFNKFKETFFNRNFKLSKSNDNNFDVDVTTLDHLDQEQPSNKYIRLEKIVTDDSTDRHEWFHLHYKPTYHPSETFCVKIQWLVCSGMLINDYVHTLIRRASRFNFVLVQTPVDTDTYIRHVESSGDINHGFSTYTHKEMDIHPFRTFVNITLPSDATVIKQKLCRSPYNFFPEHMPERYSRRFIHETGCVILEFGSRNLVWIDNPFHSLPNQHTNFNPLELLQKVQSLCTSREVCQSSNILVSASDEHSHHLTDTDLE